MALKLLLETVSRRRGGGAPQQPSIIAVSRGSTPLAVLVPKREGSWSGFSVTKFPSMFHTKIIFSFFSDLAICNHVTDVTEFISSSWEYGMSEIQKPV